MCKEFIGRDSTPRHSGAAPEQILTASITNYFGASFLGANAACTDGGSSRMRLIYAAIVHNSLSLFHFPLANIPVRRSPCFAIQKICASVYCVPVFANCGTGGNSESPLSSALVEVPW